MNFKRQYIRSKKLTSSARGQDCTLQLPCCNHNPETTVFAHLNETFAGKGIGIKADDCAGFYACSLCHSEYDKNLIPRDAEGYYVLRAYYRTIRQMILDKTLKY